MQMFGVGILELILILILTAIVVGPERMPQVAADLARWIRRARAYGQHLTRDFNEVVSELEREAGVRREDWKEIASLVSRHTADVTKEVEKVARGIEESAKLEPAVPDNVVPFEGRASEAAPLAEQPAEGAASAVEAGEPVPDGAAERPWFVPEAPARRGRRRSQ